MKLKKSDAYLIFFMAFVSFLFGIGILGRNIDTCVYGLFGTRFYNPKEFIGGYASTLTINNLYFGQLNVAIILLTGLSVYFKKLYKSVLTNSNNLYINFLTAITVFTLSLTWPFYNYFTNGFRQAVGLGFIALFLSLQIKAGDNDKYKKNNLLQFLFFFLAAFSHSSSLYILIIYIFSLIIEKIINLFNVSSISKINIYSLFLSIPFSVGLTFASGIITKSAGDVIGYAIGIYLSIFSFLILLFFNFIIKPRDLIFVPNNFISLYQILSINLILIPFNTQNVERMFTYYILLIAPFSIKFIFSNIKQSYFFMGFLAIFIIGLTMVSTLYDQSLSFNLNLYEFCQKWELPFLD
tara:strand:+ start:188 stop:1243 length:1056 start_codon:yes stop_codon:yes gene_type:complete